ncbi:MAG: thymidine phosphorylase [Spirochaetes bacterium]|nr:thymidine phosphorylase [Spirochaetota bacterium]
MNEIIARKKAGKKLTQSEIERVVKGATMGDIPDYQITALLMAVCWRGMDVEERAHLTKAMAASGKRLNFRAVKGVKADKHSTGGVGDKTSLMLAPWLAAAGVKVPMISGRGLGFTGGTLDKLAAIPGYRIDYTQDELSSFLEKTGCFVIGQTADIAPADKKIYALRDVTATVDEISLITASILSKKFAEDLDTLVMDVKCGSGAFMQNLKDAKALAKSISDTANNAGIRTVSIITAMDFPLGRFTGNTAETYEAREFCRAGSFYRTVGEKIYISKTKLSAAEARVASLVEVTVELAVALLNPDAAYDKKKHDAAVKKLFELWQSGALEKKFSAWVTSQGGDEAALVKKGETIAAAFERNNANEVIPIFADKAGFFTHCNSRALGNLMVDLGAGRKKFVDPIDDRVTLEMLKAPGEAVKKGEALARIYKPGVSAAEKKQIQETGKTALSVTKTKPKPVKNILARL